MNMLLIIAAVLAVVYCFAAIGYYYAFKNWSPMCGSHKSHKSYPKVIQWITSRQEKGKNGIS